MRESSRIRRDVNFGMLFRLQEESFREESGKASVGTSFVSCSALKSSLIKLRDRREDAKESGIPRPLSRFAGKIRYTTYTRMPNIATRILSANRVVGYRQTGENIPRILRSRKEGKCRAETQSGN